MVRTIWIGAAFVCGIVFGVVGTHLTSGSRAVADCPAKIPKASTATATPLDPAVAPAAKFGGAPLAGVPALANNPPGRPATAAVATAGTAGAAEVSAPHLIDVGGAFHQLIDRPSYPGFPNEFGDAHRRLERETRDDSWSYAVEAEIRNSLTADVSAGNIKVEFLECRSTVCEVRLCATDAHSDALNAWSETQNSMPWYQHLQSVGMSMSATNGGSQGLWLFRRPPQ